MKRRSNEVTSGFQMANRPEGKWHLSPRQVLFYLLLRAVIVVERLWKSTTRGRKQRAEPAMRLVAGPAPFSG